MYGYDSGDPSRGGISEPILAMCDGKFVGSVGVDLPTTSSSSNYKVRVIDGPNSEIRHLGSRGSKVGVQKLTLRFDPGAGKKLGKPNLGLFIGENVDDYHGVGVAEPADFEGEEAAAVLDVDKLYQAK